MAGDAELARGWQALGMSAWGDAREAFQAALDREETPEALEGLGVATGWLGDARTSVAVRERATTATGVAATTRPRPGRRSGWPRTCSPSRPAGGGLGLASAGPA